MKHLAAFLACFSVFMTIGQYGSLPLQLSFPNNHDTLVEKTPQLVWTANIAAVQSDPRISLQLVVVAVEKNQTASEAIALNTPVLIQSGLVTNSWSIGQNTGLKTNQWYAWQLSYLFNGTPVQQSDVWDFIISEKKEQVAFTAVRLKQDGMNYPLNKGRLNISTDCKGALSTAVQIQGPKGKLQEASMEEWNGEEFVAKSSSEQTQAVRYFSLDTKALGLKKGQYTLQWVANSSTIYSIPFIVD